MSFFRVIADFFKEVETKDIMKDDSVRLIDNEKMFNETMGKNLSQREIRKMYNSGRWFK